MEDVKILWTRLWWVETWLFFDWWGEYHPNSPVMEKHFLSQSESLILLHKISPERFYLLNLFFVSKFNIMIENNRISFSYWWLLEFFAGVCPLNSSLCFLKFKTKLCQYGDMSDRNVNPKVTCTDYISYHVPFSTFKYQIKNKICKMFFHCTKNEVFY